MSRTADRDPLAPLETVVLMLLGFLPVVGIGAPAIALLLRAPVSYGEWGSHRACLHTSISGLRASMTADSTEGLRPGTVIGGLSQIPICQDHMSGLDRTLLTIPDLINLTWFAGLLALLLWTIRRARRDGIFTQDTARRTTLIGGYLTVGTLAITIVTAICRTVVRNHLVVQQQPAFVDFLNDLDVNWQLLITAAGVVTVGRILQRTVPMREEIEATV